MEAARGPKRVSDQGRARGREREKREREERERREREGKKREREREREREKREGEREEREKSLYSKQLWLGGPSGSNCGVSEWREPPVVALVTLAMVCPLNTDLVLTGVFRCC